MKRRDFLKISALAGGLATTGCGGEPVRFLIPFLNPPEDIIPGRPTWYPSTCRQCPAGCGILAKNREARIIKVEGNPRHPVNAGRLCARGQAGLQDLYSPDRLTFPRLRDGKQEKRLSWDEALARFDSEAKKAQGRIAVLSGLEHGCRADLLARWLRANGARELLFFEPLSAAAVREGSRIAFGLDAVPSYDLSEADLILSLGAEFLATWISPVEFARQFTEARGTGSRNARFIYAGPRLSVTAASADRFIPLKAGAEPLFAFALLVAVLGAKGPAAVSARDRAKIETVTAGLDSEALAQKAGVDPGLVTRLGARFAAARRPLVLADGETDTVVAASLINVLNGSVPDCADYSRPHALSKAASIPEARDWMDRAVSEGLEMLIIHRSNPVYSLPGFAEAMAKVPFVAVLDNCESETASMARLVLPVHTSYETWDTYVSREGLVSLLQPVMGPVTDSRPLEMILDDQARALYPRDLHLFFSQYLASTLGIPAGESQAFLSLGSTGFTATWKGLGKQAYFLDLAGYRFRPAEIQEGLSLVAYPSLRWYDGRDANKTWLQEVPDPLSDITWDTYLEIHPDRAASLGVEEADLVEIATPHGKAQIGAHLYHGVHPEAVAIPMGMGHTRFGRYAGPVGANPLALTGGALIAEGVTLRKTGERMRFARTDGSDSQHGRDIAQAVYEREQGRGPTQAVNEGDDVGVPSRAVHANEPHHKGDAHEERLWLPIPEAYDPKIDIYPPHPHDKYRWGMVVDLDKCIGCSACMVACYAENNVATVGKKRILKRREMAWLRIERYFEREENPGVRFLPMLCQHCDCAPCETVCPVYAPTHDKEGLNLQVYNRCVGTRFCLQNDPYKVRRFNFFHYTWDAPLHLNPDVTVRTKGVMEKCSFCVQRIKAAHQTALVENRLIRDQEIVPACAQTCPAGVFTFGSFMDPDSRINQLIKDKRAYQVLAELDTKTAVIYLKKIIRDDGLEET